MFALDPGRRGVAALAAVAVVACGVTGWVAWRARPSEVTVGTPAVSMSSALGVVLVVDVAGLVRRPGIVRLPDGARVIDALRAAGGALPGTTTAGLNLARRLTDGEQVVVGPAAGPAGSPGVAAGRLDLNQATVSDLDGLPGVGPVLAQRIVDWRTAHGRFTSVDQLRSVPGIGPRKFDSLKELVAV